MVIRYLRFFFGAPKIVRMRIHGEELEAVIRELGGVTAAARLFKITPSSVACWRRLGMPGYRVDYLRLARPALAPLLPPEEVEHDD